MTGERCEEVKGKPDTHGSVRQVLLSAYFRNPQPTRGPNVRKFKLPGSPVAFQKQALLVRFLGRCPWMPFTEFRGFPRLRISSSSTGFPALRACGSDVSPQASRAFPVGRWLCDSVSSATTTLSCQQPDGLTFDIRALSHCRAGEPLKDTSKRRPTKLKFKIPPTVLPCVLARGGVSATSPRLWLAAPLAVTVQGKKGKASDVGRKPGCRPSHRPPSGRIPSIPEGTRGA